MRGLRRLPHSEEMERSVLGIMLLDNKTIDTVCSMLKEEDFYFEQYKWVYKAVVKLAKEGRAVDSLTLAEELKAEKVFDKIGGYSFITKVGSSVFSAGNAEEYCKVVKDKAVKRERIRSLSEVVDECYKDRETSREIDEKLQERVFKFAVEGEEKRTVKLGDIMTDEVRALTEIAQSTDEISGLRTGYRDLDYVLGGLQKSDLVLLGARPSMGKTAFAVNIAENAGILDKKRVVIFSLEMSANMLARRIISSRAEANSTHLKAGRTSVREWKRIARLLTDTKKNDTPIYINDTSGSGVEAIRRECRRLQAENGLDLIIIDYLQLMTTRERADNREQEIARISRGLKALAKEMNCPVIALSQLSRALEGRRDKRPMLSDLRESGAIEQDADVVMFLYRESYYDLSNSDDSTEVIIAKQRNGETGTVRLDFRGEYMRFEEMKRD